MKYYFDGIIVVEGRNDESYLSSFIESIYVVTNGYEIPKQEIAFINNKRNNKPVIILTDSDEAGILIREKLNSLLNKGINIEVNIVKCNKNGKHGVAECDKDEVINVLKEHLNTKEPNKGSIELKDLNVTKDQRDYLCGKLSLGICNQKTFIKRINYLGITLEEIKQELNNYGN